MISLSILPPAATTTTHSMSSKIPATRFLSACFEVTLEHKKKRRGPECGHGRGSMSFMRKRRLPTLHLRCRPPVISALANPFSPASAAAASPTDDLLATAANWNDHLHDYIPLVKMCGITTPEDASLAAQSGASYVGMIMWPHSKRSVKSVSRARQICAAAREFGAEPVGVFVSESASEIERVCDAAGISFAQLHGDVARASALELSKSLNLIYVMQSDAQGHLQTSISPEQERVIDWVLVDGLEGGSGLTFAWDNFKVPPLCTNKGWLLAGGLNPENVGKAISTLKPNAVDVASGIAASDGIRKDPSRILAFMHAVKVSSESTCVYQYSV